MKRSVLLLKHGTQRTSEFRKISIRIKEQECLLKVIHRFFPCFTQCFKPACGMENFPIDLNKWLKKNLTFYWTHSRIFFSSQYLIRWFELHYRCLHRKIRLSKLERCQCEILTKLLAQNILWPEMSAADDLKKVNKIQPDWTKCGTICDSKKLVHCAVPWHESMSQRKSNSNC